MLTGRHVILRPPRPSDKEDRLRSGQPPELVKMYGGDYRNTSPLTLEGVTRWYERLERDPLAWVIEVDGKAVGHCRLNSFDEDNRSARYAIGIFDPTRWGKGFGTEATRLVLRHAFEDLQLHRVDLRVLSYNRRAIASFKKCGFVEEGRERDSAPVAGEWHTDVRMSILEHDYASPSGHSKQAMLIVINGPIASGKNAVSTALAGLLERHGRRVAVIDLDEVWMMLDHQKPQTQVLENWLEARRAAAILTDEFYDSGRDAVIVNGPFFTEAERRGFVDHLRKPADPLFVTLRVSFEESWRRAQGDPRRVISRRRDWLAERFSVNEQLMPPLLATDLIVGTDARSPDEIAAEILPVATSGRGPDRR